MWYASLAPVILALAATASAEGNYFNNPSAPGSSGNFLADLAWEIGSNQTVTWTTTMDSYEMYLYHQKIDPASGIQVQVVHSVEYDGTGDQSFTWEVQTYDTNTTDSPVFFFWVDPGADEGFTSHYFNITSSSATTGTATATAATTSTSSTSSVATTRSTTDPSAASAMVITSTAVAKTTSSTAAASTPSSSDTSTALEVGLGVGLGVGMPLVLIAGIWVGINVVKARRSATTPSVDPSHPMDGIAMPPPPNSYQNGTGAPPSPYEYYQPQPPAQCAHSNEIYEAPGHPVNAKRMTPVELAP